MKVSSFLEDMPENDPDEEARAALLGADHESKFLSYSIKFIDSYQFQKFSLDTLASNLPNDKKLALHDGFPAQFHDILSRKGVFPYDYIDSEERFNETELPSRDKFYNTMTKQACSPEDYAHAQKVWNDMNMNNLGDYHDVYLKTDVLLLADVFMEFRRICLDKYRLDPAHYITAPSLTWDAMLLKTGVKLELLKDPDMYTFFETGIRGGMSVISRRHAQANNRYMPNFDITKPGGTIVDLDMNNMYGAAMKKKLPTGGFQWMTDQLIGKVLSYYIGGTEEWPLPDHQGVCGGGGSHLPRGVA